MMNLQHNDSNKAFSDAMRLYKDLEVQGRVEWNLRSIPTLIKNCQTYKIDQFIYNYPNQQNSEKSPKDAKEQPQRIAFNPTSTKSASEFIQNNLANQVKIIL